MSTKSAFEAARRTFWFNRPSLWKDATLNDLVRRDVMAAEAAGHQWDPEEVALPSRLEFREDFDGGMVIDPDRPKWYIAAVTQTATPEAQELRRRVLPAMVVAYNREQAGEVVSEKCAWPGCDNLAPCRSGNFGNQLVCSEHFTITNGIAPPCALCRKPWPHEHAPEQLVEWETKGGARGEEPEPAHPVADGDPTLRDTILREREKAKGEPSWQSALAWADNGDPVADHKLYCSALYRAEIDRRWKKEPRLRERIQAALIVIRRNRPSSAQPLLDDLECILTGKES